MKYLFVAASILTLLLSTVPGVVQAQALVTETPQVIQPPTPAEIIEAINALRLSYGLPALATHPILMQLAQRQADGIAAGLTGHWRPYGLTLGQLLIMEGYPLAGDLTQDGYRSENWIISMTAQGAIEAWLFDDEHSNTMLSEYRSDIGAGVSMSRDEWGQDQIYVVIETALQTRSGQQQAGARDFLTRLPSIINGTTSMNGTPVPLSAGQYIIPVIPSTARPGGDVFHEVQYGQSLWSIAITYGTTIKQIQAWNNLGDSNIVYEQQMLLVQKGATQPVVIPTQTATVVFVKPSSPTPSPTSTHTAIPTGTAAGRSGSIVVILIISVSLLMAGASASLSVKKAS
ncbi:MAG TPA: LysM peptidoglycan-binding domain-containing protein [Anaerolineales bacterium]|nr:LysM peptidoglycan-binding domain-containing protein [Anaerolineales bacterium]